MSWRVSSSVHGRLFLRAGADAPAFEACAAVASARPAKGALARPNGGTGERTSAREAVRTLPGTGRPAAAVGVGAGESALEGRRTGVAELADGVRFPARPPRDAGRAGTAADIFHDFL